MRDLDSIKLAALSLPVGESDQIVCPACQKPKLSITRLDDGIVYNCWRPSCSMKGYIGSNPSEILSSLAHSGFKPRVYSEPSYEIDAEFCRERLLKYQITLYKWKKNGCKMNEDKDTLIMPLRGPSGLPFGISTKTFGSSAKKSMHYIEKEQPMIHFPTASTVHTNTIILVEDIISAIKIEEVTRYPTAALLGTTLDEEKIKGILKRGHRNVVLWLDLDARAKSIETKRKYSLFFDSFCNIITPEDPKDTKVSDIVKTLVNTLGD
jgi:hypothetical protein